MSENIVAQFIVLYGTIDFFFFLRSSDTEIPLVFAAVEPSHVWVSYICRCGQFERVNKQISECS